MSAIISTSRKRRNRSTLAVLIAASRWSTRCAGWCAQREKVRQAASMRRTAGDSTRRSPTWCCGTTWCNAATTAAAGPQQKPPQWPPLAPGKGPEAAGVDLLGVPAPVGLDAPPQIRAGPGAQAVSARAAPKEPYDCRKRSQVTSRRAGFAGRGGVAAPGVGLSCRSIPAGAGPHAFSLCRLALRELAESPVACSRRACT